MMIQRAAGMIGQPLERSQRRATRQNRILNFRRNFGFQPSALARLVPASLIRGCACNGCALQYERAASMARPNGHPKGSLGSRS